MTSRSDQANIMVKLSIVRNRAHYFSHESVKQSPLSLYSSMKFTKKSNYDWEEWRSPSATTADSLLVREYKFAREEMQNLLDKANSNTENWRALVEGGSNFKPTFDKAYENVWGVCNLFSYQYGRNDCIDAVMIGFLYAIFHGMFTIFIVLVFCVVAYVPCFLYDLISGRYSAQSSWVKEQFAIDSNQRIDTPATDTMIVAKLKELAVHINARYLENGNGGTTMAHKIVSPHIISAEFLKDEFSVEVPATSGDDGTTFEWYVRYSVAFTTRASGEAVETVAAVGEDIRISSEVPLPPIDSGDKLHAGVTREILTSAAEVILKIV